MKRVLGLDIGGANLKAAQTQGIGRTQPFALWRNPQGLTAALRELIAGMPGFDVLAVTMTGELCDCFESRRQGVNAILDSVEQFAADRDIDVWTIGGKFARLEQARREPLTVAAANWLALTAFAARFAPRGSALLVDMGSTTTDIVALRNAQPAPQGLSDFERLRTGELVYTGWKRTPVCALLADGVAAEVFATAQDAYLVLGLIPEDVEDCQTADGRPATRACAYARLGRMVGLDAEPPNRQEIIDLAHAVETVQMRKIRDGWARVEKTLGEAPAAWITSGSGEFLLRRWKLSAAQHVSLSDQLGPALSAVACAYAVAVLAAEQ